jgi:NADPH:quinone reductase-like Zn-dependent oxidoreductase
MDGISNLECVPTEVPRPGPGEILVKINSVSLNFKDGEVLNGQFKHHKSISLPDIVVPCNDAAGIVFEVGSGVAKWKNGDRVMALAQPDYRTVPIKAEYLRIGIGGSVKGMMVLLSFLFYSTLGFERTAPAMMIAKDIAQLYWICQGNGC